MRSRSSRFLSGLWLAAALLIFPWGAHAQTTTLFSEDFGTETLGAWTPSPLGLASNWSTTPGVASYNGGGHTQMYAGDPSWTDYRFAVKFRLANGNNHPGGIRGRVNVPTGASYAAWIYPQEGILKLFRVSAWNIDTAGLTLLAQASVGTITSGVFHDLALDFQGSQISVVYDGTTPIQVTDTATGALTSGAVALDVSNQPIEFDDAAVTTIPVAATGLFSEDFSSTSLSGWTASPLGLFSGWSAASGSASYDGGGHTQIYAGDPEWTDYRVEAKFRLANGNNHPGGIRGRLDTSTGASYAAWIYPGDGVVKLFRSAAWHIDTTGLELLAQAEVGTITSGVFHTLALSFQGDLITVTYDGNPVLQVRDTSTSALAEGAVALDVSNQPIEFDDVTVTTNGAAARTLFGDDFDPATVSGFWNPSPLGRFSAWSTAAGTAAYDGGGHTQIWAGKASWTDYRVEAKIRLEEEQNYPGGLRGRVDSTTGASYAAWLYPEQGVVKLYRSVAWNIDTAGLTLLGEANVGSIPAEVFHTLALSFEGDEITVSFDGTDIIQETDATLASGAIALDVSTRALEFDDVSVTTGPTVPPGPTTLFADDFASGLTGWTASPLGLFSNWTGTAGVAAYNGGGHTQIYAGSSAWTDYRLDADFQIFSGSNFPGGIRGRVDTTTGASYAAWIYPQEGVLKLFRAAAWDIDTTGLALLTQATVGTITANTFHQISLVFQGNQIKVLYDDTEVISVTDSSTGALSSGAIALDVSNQPIEFDNVQVTEITGGGTPETPGDDGLGNGPGGPILILTAASNPFTRYLGEILLAEGFQQFTSADISTVSATTLAAYDVVLLGEMSLTTAQATMLSDWVDDGGNLIAMRPDSQLAGLLGITSASATLANAYLLIDTAAAPGLGLVDETIQFHGTADRYTLNGATAIATLYSTASTATSNPAATLRSVGSNGGQAAAFTYDLARSVVTTRQGNPAWSGQERDGVTPRRSDDLFFGNASSDPQTDWIDLDKVAIPQADEQQRLLANLILQMNLDRKPLPRFWYFPRGEKAVVLMTGDDHGNNGTTGRFQGFQAASPTGCSVANWECVRGTSYIFPNTPLSTTDAAAFEADGFEIGLHVNTNCADWTLSTLDGFYTSQLTSLATNFPGLPTPTTNRTHCIVWSDYATQPKVEKDHGIRLDTNYYYWPGSWVADRPGFMTGSGLPMRFADTNGLRIDVYQAATQMTDESDQSFPFTIDALLDKAIGTEGYYGVFTANMHTDSSTSSGSEAIVDSALERSVPVVSARQMLTWLDGRNSSSFGSIAWSGSTLTFTVTAASGANGLRAMLPAVTPAGTLTSLTFNSNSLAFTTETIKGISYAVFTAASGSYSAVYVP